MCISCDRVLQEIQIERMNETEIFAAFDRLVALGALQDLGLLNPNSPQLSNVYQCTNCGARWIFTAPDHAFRGELRKE